MYEQYAEQMRRAESAKERKAIIDEMCRIFAFSTAKAYKVLKESGWESGRKKRRDAGKSSVAEDTIKTVAALTKHSLRKNGKQVMPVTVARSVLLQNGWSVPVKNSRLRELLREQQLQTAELKKARPHQNLRSLYPNHVHMADPSVSLLYYSPSGKQKIVRDDEEYKNKSFLEGKEKCLRYVLIDHYSASICVRYYAAHGETASNMYDFLLYAWGQKKLPVYTFHGLPELLYWDKGSGNINKATSTALEALRVKTETHEAGNPRSKGAVEIANNIVETHFECLLKLEAVHSIDELNEAVERWCAAYNANLISGYDSRLTRYGKAIGSRHELWERIRAEQLRELPDRDVCRLIFTNGIQSRTVGGNLTISVYHPKAKESLCYSVHTIPGITSGSIVNAQPILVDEEALCLVLFDRGGNIERAELAPVAVDDAGFMAGAAVIGQEYKQKRNTDREIKNKELEALAGDGKEAAFASITEGKGFKTHSLIKPENPFIRQATGTQISVSTVEVHDILISGVEAAKRVKARLGYVPDGFIARMQTEFNNAVPSSLIDDLAAEYTERAQERIG
nr:MAG TPA: transposase [Caudoviricetes sp.]